MTDSVKPRRRYDSTGRREQAAQRRARMLDSARTRFLRDGYAATTVAAVAQDAGVSVETVYKAFTNKAGLLKAVFHVAIVGDDEPIPLLQREAIRANQAEPDPRKKLRMYGEFHATVAERAVPIQLVARGAAASDPAAAAVWRTILEERLTGMTHFATHLHEGGHLRAGLTMEEARDVLWTFNSAELWELLVIHRGWTPTRFGTWVGDMLVAALL
jgi:AcrR family transcriptional regulator